MKSEEKIVARRPTYMKSFHCIGGACEENCCAHRWLIYIDKTTYKKYKNIKNEKLKPLVNQYIRRNKKNATEQSYAKIEFGEKPQCGFLTEDKLCRLQLELGEKNLSFVCRVYPRVRNVVDDVWEECLDTSCPQAARDILLCPGGISFEETDILLPLAERLPRIIAKAGTFNKDINYYLWNLREFTMQVLKSRDYALWERLIILGLFYNQLAQMLKRDEASKIADLIDMFTKMTIEGSFKEQLKSIPKQTLVQVDLLKMISDERLLGGVQSIAYLECYRDFLKGIGFTDCDVLSLEEVAENYQKAYDLYYLPVMKEREYIFENYLVNYVFKEVFPFKEVDVYKAYVMMVVQYALIKLQLIGIAGCQQNEFNEESIVKLVFSFGKVVEHSEQYINKVVEDMEKKGYTTLAHMAILIKN